MGQEAAGLGGAAATLPQASARPFRRLSGRCPLLGWPTMLLALAADAPRSFWLTALRPGVTMCFTDLPHFLDSTAAIGPVKGILGQCTVLRRELARQPAGSPDGFELIGDGARHEAVIEDVSGRRR